MGKGVRIAQAGVPVQSAADYQMIMDERWPLLDFMFMDILDLTLSTNTPGTKVNAGGTIAYIPVFEHNLGFLPGFKIKAISSSNISLFNDLLTDSLYADERYIYVRCYPSSLPHTVKAKFWLAVCARNLNTEFIAPASITSAKQTSTTSPYGIRVLKDEKGSGITERNKDGYSLNTDAKSMAIHMHGVKTVDAGTSYNLVIDHNLSYPPTFYLAEITDETGSANPMLGKRTIAPLGKIVGLASSTATRLTVRGAQAALLGDFMYVVLKDPVDVAR